MFRLTLAAIARSASSSERAHSDTRECQRVVPHHVDINNASAHHGIEMRTTLTIDDDVLTLARGLADSRGISLGEAVSYLARRGAALRMPSRIRNGVHVFALEGGEPRFGLAEVVAALEAEDAEAGAEFWKPGS